MSEVREVRTKARVAGGKICKICQQFKMLCEFSSYAYTTNQGKRSTRTEHNCRLCRNADRLVKYHLNPEPSIARCRDRRIKNQDYDKEYRARYNASDHGKAKKAECQRCRKKKIKIPKQDKAERAAIHAIYLESKHIEKLISQCPIFEDKILGKKMHVDHIVPLFRGGLHHSENLRPLLASANMRGWSRRD
jgi:5-methylcytosine-specific restriction endonuclease McrA